MGFYDPSQLVRDAKLHSVEVRPIDVNTSDWDCTLEPIGEVRFAVRLGLRMTRGLSEKDAQLLMVTRAKPYSSVLDLARRSSIPIASLVRLARADAFHSMNLTRREASWAIKALRDETLPLFEEADRREKQILPEFAEPAVVLPPMTKGREVIEDYRSHGLSLRPHPLAFLREELSNLGIRPCASLIDAANDCRITVAGLVMVRQMPGSAKGVMFITLEDESAIANLIVWPALFDKQRRGILGSQLMACRGKVQHAKGVIHVIAEHVIDYTALLRRIGGKDEAFSLPTGRGDEARTGGGGPDPRYSQALRKPHDIFIPKMTTNILPVKARNFR
jgi:error-prone DNA polymerase